MTDVQPSGRVPASSQSAFAWTVTVPLLGVVILLLMTRWGIGTFPDSAHYIKGARQLLSEVQGASLANPDPADVVLTHLAPFYSILLAAGGLVGLDPMDGTRWLNAALFGLNIFVVGFILRRTTHHALLWVVGSLLMLGAIPVLSVHVSAMSEPVFLLLCLSGFYLLARHIETGATGFLVGAGLAMGFAFLSRYAAASAIAAGGLALILWSANGFVRRVRDAVLFGAISSLPMAAWMMRNLTVAHTATGREFVVHPVGRAHAWEALFTASSWLHIPPSVPNLVRLGVWLGLGAVVVAVAVRQHKAGIVLPAVIRILTLFVAVYGVFLAVSISLFDANTQLDDRILVPVFAAGLIVLLYALDDLWSLVSTRPGWNLVAVTALTAFLAVQMVQSARMIAGSYARGWGFTSLAWQHSATMKRVRNLPPDETIFSNAPEIIYLNTGRPARPIPKRWLPMNRQMNPEYDAQLQAVGRALGASGGVVVYFRGLTQAQRSLPSVEELTSRLSLHVLADEPDGEILSQSESLHE